MRNSAEKNKPIKLRDTIFNFFRQNGKRLDRSNKECLTCDIMQCYDISVNQINEILWLSFPCCYFGHENFLSRIYLWLLLTDILTSRKIIFIQKDFCLHQWTCHVFLGYILSECKTEFIFSPLMSSSILEVLIL